jgi:hypothetical protein
MSDEKKGVVEQITDQLKDPFDWAAAFIGGAGGAFVTFHTAGMDMGHSIPTGALGAIGLKRAIFASFSRPFLRSKANNLVSLLKLHEKENADLLVELNDCIVKWDKKIIASEVLGKRIEEIAKKDTERQTDAAVKAMTKPTPESEPPKDAGAPRRNITFD